MPNILLRVLQDIFLHAHFHCFENNTQHSDTCETDQSALQGDGSSGTATDPVVPISLEGGPQPTLVMGATVPPRPPENKRIDLGQV